MVTAVPQHTAQRSGGQAPRHRRKPRRHRGPLVALSLVSTLLLTAGGTAGVYAWSLANSFDEGTKTIENVFPDETSRPAPVEGDAAQAQNILLLGSDARGDMGGDLEAIEGQRADSIMVAHIPANRDGVQVVSIMRDSWVPIPGHGEAKINAALSVGGVSLMVQTVEQFIDVRIDHVAIVDFEGFEGLTDSLGGVTIDNPIAFESYNIAGKYFPAGPQTMNGEAALAFVRERYAFADGDYQRVRNQQLFIKAVLGKTLSAETLTNPVTVSSLVGAVAPYLAVDAELDSQYLIDLALGFTSLRSDDIAFFSAPTSGTGTAAGQSIVVVDQVKLQELRDAFRTDALATYVPE